VPTGVLEFGLGQHGADVVERDAARRRRHRIDLDAAPANFCEPKHLHLGDAGSCEICWARMVWPYSSTSTSAAWAKIRLMRAPESRRD
jgi:hypothetical protein